MVVVAAVVVAVVLMMVLAAAVVMVAAAVVVMVAVVVVVVVIIMFGITPTATAIASPTIAILGCGADITPLSAAAKEYIDSDGIYVIINGVRVGCGASISSPSAASQKLSCARAVAPVSAAGIGQKDRQHHRAHSTLHDRSGGARSVSPCCAGHGRAEA